MDVVIRALAIYLVIVALFRITGKRTMAQVTTVDLVLLLIISEATQQALLGDDFSITTAALAIITLVFLDRVADLLKFRSRKVNRLIEGAPIVLVERGQPMRERLRKEHISVEDILAAARAQQGLLRLDQIDYAILESSGGISIIPVTPARDGSADTTTPPGA
ncbi:YetF domain-containing protein [Saccharomonospora xinjiangensis]|uniref:DUF421 domain-containing protein n=1 Tax=Saccharomonospora xinjiangensis TaxID=75294 RepID=UPI00106FA16D|nr:YetF domain-containing protein [Saccharomonospora xinjiangensis]QBQ60595.1 hypothetical protein EYD13_11210 [Saccharomonospora xinjiangensis]